MGAVNRQKKKIIREYETENISSGVDFDGNLIEIKMDIIMVHGPLIG